MKIYLSLNSPLECHKLCNIVSSAINEYVKNQQTLENSIMIIEIKESTEQSTPTLLESKS